MITYHFLRKVRVINQDGRAILSTKKDAGDEAKEKYPGAGVTDPVQLTEHSHFSPLSSWIVSSPLRALIICMTDPVCPTSCY